MEPVQGKLGISNFQTEITTLSMLSVQHEAGFMQANHSKSSVSLKPFSVKEMSESVAVD